MFNFFRKKESSKKEVIVLPKVKSILCIPGPWKDKMEILQRIIQNDSSEYVSAGLSLLNLKTKEHFQLFIEPKDEDLVKTFESAGLINSVSSSFLNGIKGHEQIVYLVSETGSYEKAKAFASAGNAILEAGGVGIYVESAGKAFEANQWTSILANFEELSLYEMFVHDAIKSKAGNLFSCGMHHLGLKDAIVYGQDANIANRTLKIWASYQIIDKPIIKAGQTFSIASNAPIFRVEEELNPPYKNHELFHNPFGTWKLTKIKN